ncbi:MAG: hypothetical protein ACI9R3_003830 [Verrucomicrobiales bacterium]|jgi:hypothetical protein
MELKEGKNRLLMRLAGALDGELVDLRLIRLRPVDDPNLSSAGEYGKDPAPIFLSLSGFHLRPVDLLRAGEIAEQVAHLFVVEGGKHSLRHH